MREYAWAQDVIRIEPASPQWFNQPGGIPADGGSYLYLEDDASEEPVGIIEFFDPDDDFVAVATYMKDGDEVFADDVATVTGASLIAKERARQQGIEEGWDDGHDDEHAPGLLARAGASYAITAARHIDPNIVQLVWPFDKEFFKPKTGRSPDGRLRDLVRAGALIAAEIDRLLRHPEDYR